MSAAMFHTLMGGSPRELAAFGAPHALDLVTTLRGDFVQHGVGYLAGDGDDGAVVAGLPRAPEPGTDRLQAEDLQRPLRGLPAVRTRCQDSTR